MTNREKIIKALREADELGGVIKMSNQFRDMIVELLEEQHPVKVVFRFNHTGNKCFDHYKCPSCGSTDIYYEQHYCDDCGKALDWSELT